MSLPLRYRSLVILLLIFCGAVSSYAGWNNILQLGDPVSCGFFFDQDHGMIGTGAIYLKKLNSIPKIYTTQDGGKTWQIAATPAFAIGAVTSIMMKDAVTGYASIYSPNGLYNLWKTTDGGASWSEHTQQYFGYGTCIYATTRALIETIWDPNYVTSGGRSLDDGKSFNQLFSDGQNVHSDGIDFADDLHGVVTMGPLSFGLGFLHSLFTQDGGMNWQRGGQLPEAWGVYALKGTQTYFAMPEGSSNGATNRSLYRTLDGAKSWNVFYTFVNPFQPRFTGHIAGAGSTIYVQTEGKSNLGFYRSDDFGKSWKNVGGPSHSRDTRFVVTGCNGEVVYAFDPNGGVWKTTNGGDGSLSGPASGKRLSVEMDSIFISSSCVPARGYISFTNLNCMKYLIDSVSFSPDPYHEFSVDTTMQGLTLYINQSAVLPIKFQTDSTVTRTTSVHIHGHYNGAAFDTTIVLVARHIAAITPLLALNADSLFLSGNCADARGYIDIINRNCDSLIIDTVTFSPDLSGELSVDTVKNRLNILPNISAEIPILFQCDSDVTRETTIHVHAHSKNSSIDTTIVVRSRHSTVSGPLMALPLDSVYMETRYCQPMRRYIDLSNVNCNGLVIDSVLFNPQYPELLIDTTQSPKLSLVKFSSGSIPISFQTDSNITRQTTMHILGHSFNRTIDTTIIVIAKHSTAPEPYLADPPKANIGANVLLPVYLRPTKDIFAIRHYIFHLSYDGDVLSPASTPYEVKQTLSRNSAVKMGSPEPAGVLCTVDLNEPITQDSDLSIPLIYLRMGVTLSRNLFSAIRLDTFSISTNAPMPLCSIPAAEFIVDPLCGDSILSKYMFDGKMPGFLSVHPNPNSGGEVEAQVFLPVQTEFSVDLTDVQGVAIRKLLFNKQYDKGIYSLKISTAGLPGGTYFLRLHPDRGSSCATRLVISK